MMILICFGTRPEWIKVKPLVDALDTVTYKLLHTGQHTDLLNEIDVDYKITIPQTTNRLDDIIAHCILGFPDDGYDSILVQGDTASAFGCAIAGFNRGKKIYYLESGLRTGDMKNPYPEEGYRQMISRIADVHFAPTLLSEKNLRDEGVFGEIHVTGNTILDTLGNREDVSYNNQILITLHRRENHPYIHNWFISINELVLKYPQYEFILPLHPNPEVSKWRTILTNVSVIEPLSHKEFVQKMKECRFIISDSGGIQEEATFFNKKVIVCRKTTERPEGMATGHLYLCPTPDKLLEIFDIVEKNPYIWESCPYGDGYSAKKIKNIIENGYVLLRNSII
jgi:UDP-N-acetylglucosamine 2-epimerase (non-hydrolysing)